MSSRETVCGVSLMRSMRHPRRGVTGAWIVVALVSLIGIAALVVDIGRMTVVAQHVQNVADATALAGASGLPDMTEAIARLQAIVQANNVETPTFAVELIPGSDVQYYGPGQAIAGYGTLQDDERAIEVNCRSTMDYTFGRIFGLTDVTIARSATAILEPASEGGGGGGGVFFAEESRPGYTGVVVNGSFQYVGGNIHSNSRVVINGSHQTVTGMIEYREQCTINGSHQDIGDTEEGDIEDYPVDYRWDDFYYAGPYDYTYVDATFNGSNQTLPSGTWHVQGTFSVNGTRFSAYDSIFVVDGHLSINSSYFEAHNCLFICNNGITVNGAHIEFDNCTFVAGGGIVMNSALKSCSFNSDCDGLFAMALGDTGIVYNGAKQTTEGILYAPNGPITYNGAQQEVYRGGLAAKTITINGAQSTFNPHEVYGFGGRGGATRVRLIR